MLQVIFYLSYSFLSIPIGMLADKYGYKLSMLISLALLSFNSLVQIYAHELIIFSLVFAIQGVSFACLASCSQSFIFTKLKDENKLSEHVNLLGRLRAVSAISLGISMWVGGILQSKSWGIVFFAEILCMVLSVTIMAVIQDVNIFSYSDKSEKLYLKNIYVDIVKFWFRKEKIPFAIIVLSIAFLGAIETPYFIFAQELFQWYKLSISDIATLFAFIQVSAGILTILAGKISRRFSFKQIILVSTILVSLISGLNYYPFVILAIILFLINNIICEIVKIIFNDVVQRQLPDKIRASATGLIFFIESIFLSLGYMFVGYLFDVVSPNKAIAALSFIGMISFILAYAYFIIERKFCYKNAFI